MFGNGRETLSAKVIIPELLRDINLFIPNNHPLFGFNVTLGLIPDFIFQKGEFRTVNGEGHRDPSKTTVNTEWFPSVKGSKQIELEIK
jgi:hypothetical protein